VIAGCDAEHANGIQRQANQNARQVHSGKDDREADDVNHQKRQRLHPVGDAEAAGGRRCHGGQRLTGR
jgi:hypothetical protein